MKQITLHIDSVNATLALGRALGRSLKGGEVLQLTSDVGGGKTTFVKGLAEGMGSSEVVQSPTFVIGAVYECSNGKQLHHYDFYRLTGGDPGIMKEQLTDSLHEDRAVVVIEWGEIVANIIQKEVIAISIEATEDKERNFTFTIPQQYLYLYKTIEGTK